jgi:hypothetical protein
MGVEQGRWKLAPVASRLGSDRSSRTLPSRFPPRLIVLRSSSQKNGSVPASNICGFTLRFMLLRSGQKHGQWGEVGA